MKRVVERGWSSDGGDGVMEVEVVVVVVMWEVSTATVHGLEMFEHCVLCLFECWSGGVFFVEGFFLCEFFFAIVPTRFKRRNHSERIIRSAATNNKTKRFARKHRKQFAAQDQGRHMEEKEESSAKALTQSVTRCIANAVAIVFLFVFVILWFSA